MNEHQIRMILKLGDEFSGTLRKLAASAEETMAKVNASFASDLGISKFKNNIEDAKREVKALEGELSLLSKFKATPEVKLETDKAQRDMKELRAKLDLMASKNVKIKVDVDRSNLDRLNRSISELDQALTKMNGVGTLFGRAMSAATLVLGPLASAAIAAAGAITAMAVSLGAAATAVGVLAVGLVAQAIPAIGLLVLSMMRVKKVMEAVKAEQKAGTTAAADHTAQMQAQQQAAQGLIRAHEQLKDARREARRQLEDLTLAEKRARLEAQSATLSQIESGQALRTAVRTGASTIDVRRAQIDSQGSGLAVTQANLGVSRLPENRAQVQELRGVRDATWALVSAQQASALAAKNQGSAQTALNEAMKGLSPQEKRLKEAIERLQKDWKKVSVPLTSSIVDAFSYITNGVRGLIDDPEIQAGIKRLSGAMSDSFKGFFDTVTSPAAQQSFKELTKNATVTFPKIADALGNLFNWMNNIAIAAQPLVDNLVTRFDQWTKGIADSAGDRDKMEKTFAKIGEHFDAWWKLLGSILSLFGSLFDVAGEEGKSLVEDLTGQINRLADFIHENEKSARDFFKASGDAVRAIGRALITLGKTIAASFSPKWIENIAKAFEEVFVPGVTLAWTTLWLFTNLFVSFLQLPYVKEFGQFAVGFLLIAKAVTMIIGGIQSLIGVFMVLQKTVVFLLGGVGGAAEGATGLAAISPAGWVLLGVIALVAILYVLEKKFGAVSKAVGWVTDAAKDVFNWFKEHWDELLVLILGPVGLAIVGIIKNFDKIKGAVVAVFNWLTENTPIDEFFGKIGDSIGRVVDLFKDMIDPIKTVFEGIGKVFQGFWEILEGLTSGDGAKFKKGFSLIFDGIKTIAEGAFKAIYAAIRFLWNGFADAVNVILEPINAVAGIIPGGSQIPDVPHMEAWGGGNSSTRAVGGIAGGSVVTNGGGGGGAIGAGANEGGSVGGLVAAVGGGSGGGFVSPVPGGSWGGAPGAGTHSRTENGYVWQDDDAYDVFAADGTPVVAAFSGTVGPVRPFNNDPRYWGYGLYLSGSGGQMFYKHLKDVTVQSGTSVRAGQVLGHLGTGVNGGPHLHLAANPISLLYSAKGGGAPSAAATTLNASYSPTSTSGGGGSTGGATAAATPPETFSHYFSRLTGKPLGNKSSKYLVKYARQWFPTDRKGAGANEGGTSGKITGLLPDLARLGNSGDVSKQGFLNVLTKFGSSLDELFGILTEEFTKFSEDGEKIRKRAMYRFDRFGAAFKKFGDQAEVVDFDSQLERIGVQRGMLLGRESLLNKTLGILESKLAKANSKAAKQLITAQINKTKADLLTTGGDLGGLAESAMGIQADRRDAVVTAAMGGEAGQRQLEQIQRDESQQGITRVDPARRENLIRSQIAGLQRAQGDNRRTVRRGKNAGGGLLTVVKDPVLEEMLKAQVQELSTQLGEAVVATVRAAGQRNITAGQRSQHLAELLGKGVEAVNAAIGQQMSASFGLIASLSDQRAQAIANGNMSMADQLDDEIADLNASVIELAQKQFQNLIDDVNKKADAAMAMTDVESQIAQISGPGFAPDYGKLVGLAQQRGSELTSKGAGIQGLLSQAIAAGMPQDTINDLRLQLKQNELAVLQNNQNLAELTGSLMDPQQFSSASWRQFRMAAFSGEASLLPVPHMASGGYIKKTGLFYLHSGETVRPGGRNAETVNLFVTNPTEVADPSFLASRFAFEMKGKR